MRLVAEVIASAFSSGLSWRGSLAGKEVFCPPPGLNGHQIMSAFEQFLQDNPDMAERPYGDAMAASLNREFPCQAQ
jgi:hypothetical protein